MIEGGENLFRLPAVGINGDGFSAIVSVEVAKNVSLRIQQEGVRAVIHGKVTDIVGDHAVQPAHAIAARKRDFGAEAEIVNAAILAQLLELGLRIAKARCG